MFNDEYNNEIRKIIKECNNTNYFYKIKNIPYLYNYILDNTKQLNSNYKFKTRIYWVLHHITEFPKCQNCQEIMYIDAYSYDTMRSYCSQKCANSHSVFRENVKKTLMKKYGVDNPMKSIEICNKMKENNIKKYGCCCTLHNPDIHTKVINIFKRKYGSESAITSDIIKQKSLETIRKRYNCNNVSQNHDIRLKQQSKYKYNNIIFDSGWELYYYIYLKDQNKIFEYQPKIHFEYFVNNVKHIYYPDFKVDDILIDIKGDHFFDKNGNMICPWNRSKEMDKLFQEKFKCMINNNIKIIKGDVILPIIKEIDNKYGNNYYKKFKIINR